MDTESLSQVEQIIKSATADLRQDIVDLRQATDSTATALHQDIADLRQSTDSTATALRQDIADLRQSTDSTATAMTDLKRHTGVLVEGLRHDIQMVAEGFQLHLDRRHTEDREYIEGEFREMRALLKLSYTQLHDRVEALDNRVNRIEQHLGLSS